MILWHMIDAFGVWRAIGALAAVTVACFGVGFVAAYVASRGITEMFMRHGDKDQRP